MTEARDPRTHAFLPDDVIAATLTDPLTVADAVAALRDTAVDWTRGSLNDDIALVLIEYCPPEPARPEHIEADDKPEEGQKPEAEGQKPEEGQKEESRAGG